MSREHVVPAGKAAPFALVDERDSVAAPEPRREMKFALPYADLGKLMTVLSANFRRVRHHDASTIVRSVYLDDARLNGYHESVEGTGNRRKVRVRWYNDDDREGRFFFEIKKRVFDLVVKNRVAIQSPVALGELTYREIGRRLESTLPPPHREILARRSSPVLLSEYRREYFEGADRRQRVTVDSGLKWYSQIGRNRISRRFAVELPHLVVVELKTPAGSKLGALRHLHPLRLTPTRSSKYVVGCQQLALVADTRGSLI